MRTSARGFTLVETLVAFLVGVVVMAVSYSLWSLVMKQGKAAQSSTAVTALAYLEGALYEDLLQIGMDPATGRSCHVTPDAFAFYKCTWNNGQDEPVTLVPVTYRLRPTPHKNQVLYRIVRGAATRIPNVVLRNAKFQFVPGPDAPSLRLDGLVMEADDADTGVAVNDPRSVPVALIYKLPVWQFERNPKLRSAMHLVPFQPLP